MTISVANAIGRPTSTRRGASACSRRRVAVAALRQPVHDVLDHDDRGVDQQPDGDRQAAERHRVEPDAQRLEQEPGERDRQRDGQRHDAAPRAGCRAGRRAPGRRTRAPSSTARPTPPSADVDQLATGRRRSRSCDARRQAAPESAIAARMPAATAHGVGAELLDDAAADDLAREPVREAAPDRRRLAHVGDVAEQHRRRCRASRPPSRAGRRRSRARPTRAHASTRSAPATTMPPAAFTFAPSTACITSSSVTPRADMRSGSSWTWNWRR